MKPEDKKNKMDEKLSDKDRNPQRGDVSKARGYTNDADVTSPDSIGPYNDPGRTDPDPLRDPQRNDPTRITPENDPSRIDHTSPDKDNDPTRITPQQDPQRVDPTRIEPNPDPNPITPDNIPNPS